MSEPVMLPGGHQVHVVGESHYQDALDLVCGGKTSSGHCHECMAVLHPEPENPYDANAVAVCIDGHQVGHLSRDAAKAFAPIVFALGGRDAACAAVVNGGWSRRGDDGYYGVTLDLAGPDQCLVAIERQQEPPPPPPERQPMTGISPAQHSWNRGVDTGERITAGMENSRIGLIRTLGRFNRKLNPHSSIRNQGR